MKHKYKVAAIAMSLILAVTSVVAANPATGEAGVRLNKKKATLYVGKSVKLKVLGTKKKAKWSSSNESVAVVSGSGKVYAFGTGTAKITAKVKKKKYVCKVTVKKKKKSKKPVQVTPIRTAAPTVTPMPTVTPIPTATPIVTKAPDVNNNVNTITNSTLAANIETSLEKLPSGQVIAKVTNKNSVNVDRYTLNFQFKDAKGTVLGTDTQSGFALSKGASQYVLAWASDKAEKTDVNKSQISVTADKDLEYLDGSADMQITAEPTESRGVAVTFKNKSSHNITGYALIVFKDAKGKMVAVRSTDSCICSAGETKFEDVSAPTYEYDTDEHRSWDDVEYATAEVLNYSYYY